VRVIWVPRTYTPSTMSFFTSPSLPRVSAIRFPGSSGISCSSTCNIQQTVFRPSSSHRHVNGGRLSIPNKVILISYLVLCIALLLHDRCVSSGRSVHYANRFPEDTSKGIGRNPSCSFPRRCATALHGGVHRRCPHTRARTHKNEGVELD